MDEYFDGFTGDGSEGDLDMYGPWTSSFGLHPVESEIVGGKVCPSETSTERLVGRIEGSRIKHKKANTSPLWMTQLEKKFSGRKMWLKGKNKRGAEIASAL